MVFTAAEVRPERRSQIMHANGFQVEEKARTQTEVGKPWIAKWTQITVVEEEEEP